MLIAVAGTKGAPGVTTLAFGLARLEQRNGPVLLVEADPDGGCLAARLGLRQEPGLSTLAAAGRHDVSATVLAENAQTGPGHMAVFVAPSSPHHAGAALRAAGSALGATLADLDGAVALADLGRLDGESPALPLARAAHQVILLTRPTLEGADALAVRLVELAELRSRASLLTFGDGPYDGAELAEVLSIAHAGHLPEDPAGATFLWSAQGTISSARRPLLRALSSVIDHLGLDTSRPSPSVATPVQNGSNVLEGEWLAQGAAP